MSKLEQVLALRPTNVVARLGARSRLPLLNPRDLARALDAGGGAAMLCVPLPSLALIPGLLRAARDRDAVLGLACPHPPVSRDGVARFFEAVRAAAEEIGHCRPLFLQAGPLRIGSTDTRAVDRLAAELYRYIDAGFTLVSLDASALPPADNLGVCAELARAASERELALELAAPRLSDGRPSARGLRTYLEGLARRGVEVRFIRLSASTFTAEALGGGGQVAGDLAALEDFREVAAEQGAWLTIDDRGAPPRLLPSWREAGVRKVDAGEPFARLLLFALPAERREAVLASAPREGAALAERLGCVEDPLAGQEPRVRDRAEALAYGEVSSLLRELGGIGSARRTMAFLADSAGY